MEIGLYEMITIARSMSLIASVFLAYHLLARKFQNESISVGECHDSRILPSNS